MLKTILLFIMKPTILVGGQAVIEGVMMRVPGAYATAVRDPNGKIHVDRKKFIALGEKSLIWKQPILRGMAGLYESMKMGMETLHWSADIAMPDEKNNAYEQYAYCNFQINHQKHGDANLQPHQAMLNRLFDTTILLDPGPAMTQVINSTADQP